MFPSLSDAGRGTFITAGFQRSGSKDGTSPKGVLPKNHVTCLASWHPLFLLFSISDCLERCGTCSVQFWSALWLLPSLEEASGFSLIPSPTADTIQAAHWQSVCCCLSLHLSRGSWRQGWFYKLYIHHHQTSWSCAHIQGCWFTLSVPLQLAMNVGLIAKCDISHSLHSAVLQSLLAVVMDYVRKQKAVWCFFAFRLDFKRNALEGNGWQQVRNRMQAVERSY